MRTLKWTMSAGEPISGDLDIDAMHAWTPKEDTLKGMFFSDMVAMLDAATWEGLKPKLDQPPKLGKYVPFSEYPIRDLQLIQRAVVNRRFPKLGLREGYRQLGRTAIETFRKSTVGTVIFATLSDPMSALKKYPEARNLLTRAGRVSTEARGEREAIVRYVGFHGIAEYDAGVLEAVVLYFKSTPTMAVTVDGEDSSYTVRW